VIPPLHRCRLGNSANGSGDAKTLAAQALPAAAEAPQLGDGGGRDNLLEMIQAFYDAAPEKFMLLMLRFAIDGREAGLSRKIPVIF
jgi:hypothetical protein